MSAVALAAGVATAEEPNRIGWIDNAAASSDCIGDAKSPVCVVETALACRLRNDPALCRTAGLNPDEALAPTPTTRPPKPVRHPAEVIEATAVEYRIDDMAEELNSARITVGARFHGEGGLLWPESGWRRLTYTLVRDSAAGKPDERWRIVETRWVPLVRWLGPVDAASSCIGDPKTPLCAVETHIACRVRSDDDICDAAGRVEARHFRPHHATVLYFVDRIRRWEPPEPVPHRVFSVVVWMAESTEFPAPGATPNPGDAYITRPTFVLTSYTLERQGTTWRVVSRSERP